MNKEQLLQEARIEAEKAIPNGTYNIDCFDECVSEIAREGYVEGYIANAKKQMSEAVEFNRFTLSIEGTDLMNEGKSLEMIFNIFKQKQE